MRFTLNLRFNASPRIDVSTILWTYACIVNRYATCPAAGAGLTSDVIEYRIICKEECVVGVLVDGVASSRRLL